MFYPDLSTKCQVAQGDHIRAVGWLGLDHPYPQGPVPPEFLAALREHVRTAWQPVYAAGIHFCEFCPAPKLGRSRAGGAGNVWIPSAKGVVYVAPALIVHYIEAHGYRPPDEFIAAVIQSQAASHKVSKRGRGIWLMTLFQNISRVRLTTWVAVLAGAGGAVWSAAFTKTSWHLEPIQLVGFGFVALAVVNIVVFVINLCLSMPKWSRAENDQELEQVARPALQGEPTEMGKTARQVVGVLMAACIGVMAGGVCAGLVRLIW